MLSPLRRVRGFLRSRKLAVWLLLLVMVWSFIATVVPQQSRDPGKVAPWGARHPVAEAVVRPLGLHDAHEAPLFLGVIALLFASTTACAWERVRASLKLFAGSKGLTEAEIRRLTSFAEDASRGAERASGSGARNHAGFHMPTVGPDARLQVMPSAGVRFSLRGVSAALHASSRAEETWPKRTSGSPT